MMVTRKQDDFIAWCDEHGGYPLPRHTLGLKGVCEECGSGWPCPHEKSEVEAWREMVRDLRRRFESERNGILR